MIQQEKRELNSCEQKSLLLVDSRTQTTQAEVWWKKYSEAEADWLYLREW